MFHTKQGNFQSKTCIIATGGKSAKKTGSDGSGIPYSINFGHKIIDMVPALVQLQGKQTFLKEISGVRIESKVELYIENKKVTEELGELQLTEFGVSGIPVFQVSRYAAYALLHGKSVNVKLNFLPDLNEKQAKELIQQRFLFYGEGKTAKEALVGLFPQKLNVVFLRESGIKEKKPASDCSKKELEYLAYKTQHFIVDIVGTKNFEESQVTAGGIDTDEICSKTMESKLVSGLYFAGELIDIDGMCGGYNLQWAWSSGSVAGISAAKYCKCK